MIKRTTYKIIFLLVFIFSIKPIFAIDKFKIKTVFIDPGHGGSDPGCHGVFSKEADVALKISLQVGAIIKSQYPDINVVYSRTTDVFVDLYERARMANKVNADLFICIHCNASKNHGAYGTETFSMGLHRTDDNFEVAKRENSVILLENNYKDNYSGFDPNDPASYIMFSMLQNANLDQSVSLASKVQEQFESFGRFNRGVQQAGFAVLVYTSMPSILIETGFLTNPSEESYMNSEDGMANLSNAIYNAFDAYKNEVEMNKKGSAKPRSAVTTQTVDTPKKIEATESTDDYYRVQFFKADEPISLEDKRIQGIDGFIIEQDKNRKYKYLSSKVLTQEAALKLQNEIRKLGFIDAFIVPYKNGIRQNTNNVQDN